MTNKYQHGKIYSIRNNINDDIYIGSTTTTLCNRMVKHRCFAKTCKSNIYMLRCVKWD